MLRIEPKQAAAALALLAALSPGAQAQEQIWRCGNEYTNHPGDAKARGCKPLEGGNVTVVEGFKPRPAAPAAAPARGPVRSGDGDRIESAEQRARDADARAILESELRKTETRLAELRAEYQGGEPDKRGDEFRNHQRYLDRVAALREQIARAESDVAALRRELQRAR